MKHTSILLTLLCLFLFSNSIFANKDFTFEDKYTFITKYSDLAVKEMHRTGIPASVTMAQFILETDWGRADLFVEANASFGIKCKNGWNGETFYKKDDDLGADGKLIPSCFRAYSSVEEAFIDHSNFLKNRSYYASLFELDSKDYRGWSYGLKNCKYATDIKYPKKLIDIIEVYGLNLYDFVADISPINQKIETVAPATGQNQMFDVESNTNFNLAISTPSYKEEDIEIAVPRIHIPETFQVEEKIDYIAYVPSSAPVRRYEVVVKRDTSYTIKPSSMRPASSF